MQAPAETNNQPPADEYKPVLVLTICTKEGVHFHDTPTSLFDVMLSDYVNRNGPVSLRALPAIARNVAIGLLEILDDGGLYDVAECLLDADGDYMVVDTGEGFVTYCVENGMTLKAVPSSLN